MIFKDAAGMAAIPDPDPGPLPALVTTDEVNDAVDALLPWQHRRMLHFLAGYDTEAVARAVAWVRDGMRR